MTQLRVIILVGCFVLFYVCVCVVEQRVGRTNCRIGVPAKQRVRRVWFGVLGWFKREYRRVRARWSHATVQCPLHEQGVCMCVCVSSRTLRLQQFAIGFETDACVYFG